ncbi:MAG: hypothetical protein LUC17_04075 [Oscillospiraceae bacterium]|nr:hypothetical protein [Oscillospiraceae bacterium]
MLTREEFCDIIRNIEEVESYTDDLNEVFHKHQVDGYLFQPSCEVDVVKLLCKIFNVPDYDNAIEYFCYELAFGKKYEEGSIVDTDGKEISLATASDLYDYLCSLDSI